jgi:hypothetical protein
MEYSPIVFLPCSTENLLPMTRNPSQFKIISGCIFSLSSKFSSEKIHPESEGIILICEMVLIGFNWFTS